MRLNSYYHTVALLFLSIHISNIAFPIGIPYYLYFIIALFVMMLIIKMDITVSGEYLFWIVGMFLFFLNGVALTGIIEKEIQGDIFKTIDAVFGGIIISSISHHKGYKFVINKIAICLSSITVVLSLLGLLKFYLLFHGTQLSWIANNVGNEVYPWGTSLVLDYNMYAMVILLGIVALYYIHVQLQMIPKVFYFVFMISNISAVVLSASRRGIIVIGFLVMTILFKAGYVFLKKSFISSSIKKKTFQKLIVVSVILLCLVFGGVGNYLTNINNVAYLNNRLASMTSGEQFASSRMILLDASKDLADMFTVQQHICGDGFNYLSYLAWGDTVKTNYPHNFFVSAYLYGGALAFLAMAIFFVRLLILWISGIRRDLILSTSLVILMLFFFVSNNSILSAPILWYYIVLLFLSHDTFKRKGIET